MRNFRVHILIFLFFRGNAKGHRLIGKFTFTLTGGEKRKAPGRRDLAERDKEKRPLFVLM